MKCDMCKNGELDDNGDCDNCPASNETSRNAAMALTSLLVTEGVFDNGSDARHDILMNNEKYAERLYEEEKRICNWDMSCLIERCGKKYCSKCGKVILDSERIPGMPNYLCFKHCAVYAKDGNPIEKQIILNYFCNALLYKKMYPKIVYN